MSTQVKNVSAVWRWGLAIGLIIIMASSAWATVATPDEARQVSLNWLNFKIHQNGTWAGDMLPYLVSQEDMYHEGVHVGYYFGVAPEGYIVVPRLKELPAIKRFYEAWKDDERVQFFMIGVGENHKKILKFREEHDAHQLPMLCDPYLICKKKYVIKNIPVAIVIDQNKIIQLRLDKTHLDIDEILTEKVKELLGISG